MPLIVDGDITKGFIRKRVLLFRLFTLLGVEYIPEPIYNYAKRISEITGLPLEEVLKSKPVRKLLDRWTKYVPVNYLKTCY